MKWSPFTFQTNKTEYEPWLPDLAHFLLERNQTEAIRINTDKRTISIATIGAIDLEALQQDLLATLQAIEEKLKNPHFSPQHLPAAFNVRQDGSDCIIQKPSCLTAPKLWQWRHIPWPNPAHKHQHAHDWEWLAVSAISCGIFGFLGYFLENEAIGPTWLAASCFLISFLCGGWDALHDVIEQLPKGQLDIHFLMLMVAFGASLVGAWEEGALLLFLFSASGAMEAYAFNRTRQSIDSLFKKAPQEAWKLDENGQDKRIAVEQVAIGNVLRVKPGDLFPVDGVVLDGQTAVDESSLTGEAIPVEKTTGDNVYSGTINLWGNVKIQATRIAAESSFQKIIRLIQEAQHLRAPSQRFTERFGTHYTVGILGLTVSMFFVWWLGMGMEPFYNQPGQYSAFYQAMTLLVVASPCALVLSIPSAILAAIAWGAMRGILFRGGAAIEQLADVRTVALDKTGTLTTGELAISSIESFPPGQEHTVLQWAASLENLASHPLARAIVRDSRHKQQPLLPVEAFKALNGLGVQGVINQQKVILGKRELLEQGPLTQWAKNLPPPSAEYAEVWVIAPTWLGRILLKDQIREESAPVLSALKALGIYTVMLTGDHHAHAESVGMKLGIQAVQSGLKPEAKVCAIEKLKKETKGLVAMVGDGLNDAPCLAAANIAVAMGARGSDAALEQSHVILMNDRIDLFLSAYRLSCQAQSIIRQNLALSLITIIVMIASSLLGLVPLALGVVAHEGSTVIVCLNSLRLLFWKPNPLRA